MAGAERPDFPGRFMTDATGGGKRLSAVSKGGCAVPACPRQAPRSRCLTHRDHGRR
ncbi:Hypothetical protein RMP42_05847 [Roseomonas mucosa]|nr:Hypothetical protein RMP42_05847 [Roseomonas mucosa]